MADPITLAFHPVSDGLAGEANIGSHRLVADRPDGVAGGKGSGLNGAQFFAAALGGCFWNDLHYAAAELDAEIDVGEVKVDVHLSRDPLRIKSAEISAIIGGVGAGAAFEHAKANSTVANSIMPAIDVNFARVAP